MTNINHSSILIALLCLAMLWLSTIAAQDSSPTKSAAMKRFESELENHKRIYFTNRKVHCKVTFNTIEDQKIAKTVIKEYQYLFDDQDNLVQEVISDNSDSCFDFCTVYTKNSLFRVEKASGKFRLAAFADNRNPSQDNPGLCARSSAFPYLVTSLDGNFTQLAFVKCKRVEDLNARNIIYDSFSPSRFADRDCMSLARHGKTTIPLGGSTSDSVFKSLHHYDHNHHMVYLGGVYETEGNASYPKPHKVIDQMEYITDPTSKILLPKRYTRNVTFNNVTKIPEVEIDFVSYVDFAPDPDAFRLEKKYGLRTPTSADDLLRAGSNDKAERFEVRRSYWWIVYLSAAVILFGVLGFWIYRRRRQPA